MSQDNYAEQLRTKGSHIASDIAGIGAVLKEAGSEKLHAMKDAASDKLHSIKDAASERLTAIKDGAVSRAEAVDYAVKQSPWKSVFVAAGVGAGLGIVAGIFLRRR